MSIVEKQWGFVKPLCLVPPELCHATIAITVLPVMPHHASASWLSGLGCCPRYATTFDRRYAATSERFILDLWAEARVSVSVGHIGFRLRSVVEVLMKVLSFIPRSDLQKRVAKALGSAQFSVENAASARETLALTKFAPYAGILVDSDSLIFQDIVLLVGLLRQQNPDTSIFVFARYLDLDQRLQLFEAGADDCVREPFFASELAVRLGLSIRLRQAASCQAASRTANLLSSGGLELDLIRRRASRSGKPIDLRPKEFLLLEYLVRNANRPVTRTMILEHVWSSNFEGLTNVVDVYISALRSKVDRDFSEKLIKTNRGIGYTFTSIPSLPRALNSMEQTATPGGRGRYEVPRLLAQHDPTLAAWRP
jgi:two-component system OmpR family response regulator